MTFTKPQVLLLSIKPPFVQKILDGRKTVELRKVRPQLSSGDFILVYESSPTKSLIGWFEVQEIICEQTQVLWKRIKNDAGITKKEFDTYYHKSNFGVAIRIEDKYTTKIPLDEVRQKWKNFKPPQSFHYLNDEDISIAEEITGFPLPKFQGSSQLILNYR